MTGYILLIILFLLFLYTISNKWFLFKYKILYLLINIFIFTFLILSLLDYKISQEKKVISRKTIFVLYDISDSMDYDYDKLKMIVEESYKNFNINFIPFSNKIFGLKNSKESLIYSSINEAIEYINSKYKKEQISNLLIVTDGNETKDLNKMKVKKISNFKHPINVLYINKEKFNTNFDRHISFIKYPKFISRFTKEKITFAVSTLGEDISSLIVQLKVDGSVYATNSIEIVNNYGEGSFDLELRNSGDHFIELNVPIDSRERNIKNNYDYGIIKGVMDEYRILHVSGHPSTDTAFIRRSLQNIPGIDLISFFILRTSKQLYSVDESQLSLIPFPTEELFDKELNHFDAIISNDFKFSEYLPPKYLNNIKEYVKNGGNLLSFGGPESFNKDYDNSIFRFINSSNFISEISPIKYTKVKNYQNIDYKIKNNILSKIFAFDYLPNSITLNGLNKVGVKERAIVLLETDKGEPLIVSNNYGKGKVISVLTDEFWNFSYFKNIKMSKLSKVFLNYIMGIYKKPVYIDGEKIRFTSNGILKNTDNNLVAKLSFYNMEGNIIKTQKITYNESIDIKNYSKSKVSVDLSYSDKELSSYYFYIYKEPEGDEFSKVPYGKIFLSELSSSSNGKFIETKTIEDLSKFEKGEYFTKISTRTYELNIFKIKYLILLLIFSLLASYYLRSRYML